VKKERTPHNFLLLGCWRLAVGKFSRAALEREASPRREHFESRP
jgi:hypothetical protein